MSLGSAIIGIIMILLFVVPVVILNRKKHKADDNDA